MQAAYIVKPMERAGRGAGLYIRHLLFLEATILSPFFNSHISQPRQILLNNYSAVQTNMTSLSFKAIKLITAAKEDSALQPVLHHNFSVVVCINCGNKKPDDGDDKCSNCKK